MNNEKYFVALRNAVKYIWQRDYKSARKCLRWCVDELETDIAQATINWFVMVK